MKCTKAQELFSSYLENTIQPPMGVALEQHLAECDRCKAEYGRFHATTVVLDELSEVEPPADLHAMIMARVEEARRTAPSRVKWWNFDWQSAFTVRVPAKAIAGAAAAVLAFIGLAQFGPLHTMTASFFGGQRAVSHPVDDTAVPGPLPIGFKTDFGQYVAVGAGLSIGVRVDSRSDSSTVYMMRLQTSSKTPVQLQVSLMSSKAFRLDEGAEADQLYKGTVSRDREAVVPVPVTQSGGNRGADVAVVKWVTDSGTKTEYVFLPCVLGSASHSTRSATGSPAFVLNVLSADYGAVILAPGSLKDTDESVAVSGRTAFQAISHAGRQAGMSVESLGSSIYVVK